MSVWHHWKLRLAFRRRRPWITRFSIDGREYGGFISYGADARIQQFFDAFPAARNILELGSLEGGQTFRLAERPGSRVTAIEARHENVEKARFVQRLLGVENVEFHVANLEDVSPGSFGEFDAIFCSGLLYHLPAPWALLDSLRSAAPGVLIWTHYADRVEERVAGVSGHWYSEQDTSHPLSGMSKRSFFVTREDLVGRLRQTGFRDVVVLDDDPDHEPFPCITLIGRDR